MIPREDIYNIIHMNTQNFDLSELKDKDGTKYYDVKVHESMKMFGDGFYEELVDTIHNDILKRYDNQIMEIYSESTGDFCIYIKDKDKMNEAEYKGKKVKIGKPMRGDVKKYKVFVKNPKTGNVKKVNFGDKNMEIKRDDPERRKSFRARHKCDTAKDRTTPRYWSCRFWGKNPVSDLLNEIIEPDSIKVDGFGKKDELCPLIWDNQTMVMHDDVRKALLRITKEFIEWSSLDKFTFKDIILTGSLANYNYTDQSDLDLHVLMDFSQISDDKELVGEYLKNKKTLWNDKMPIQVKGHDVELYVQDINEPHTSTGIYSLMNNDWSTKPIKEMVSLDVGNIQLKAADIMNAIDDLKTGSDQVTTINEIDKLLEKIKKMRKSGLEKEGEFSTENIVFKILRNSGYIDQLVEYKNNLLTQELTLEGVSNINEVNVRELIRKTKNTGIVTLGLIVGILAAGTSTPPDLVDMGVPQEMIDKAQEFMDTAKDDIYRGVTNLYNRN